MSPFRRRSDDSGSGGTAVDALVLGLGNPGTEYAGTRHNVGVEVVELLAERHGARLRAVKRQPLVADEIRVDGRRMALAVPTVYMNESGIAAAAAVRRFHVDDLSHLVVVHDELDLPVGRFKIKEGGGLAGHNGLRSIKQHLKSADFLRVRIGVGKPHSAEQGANHVLSRPTRSQRAELDEIVSAAADAVELLVEGGVDEAMNRYN